MRLRLFGLLLLVFLAASGVWAQDATPEATSEAETTSAPVFPETFTDESGAFSLSYPEGWLTRGGYGSFYVANSQRALNHGFGDIFDYGEVQIGVFTGTLADLIPDADLPANADVEAVARFIVDLSKQQSEEPVTFSEAQLSSINDQPAAGMTFTRAGTDGYALIIAAEDDVYIALQMLTSPHELDQWLPTAHAIAATITLKQPEPLPDLTESFMLPDESFTIHYPQGWTARERSPNGVDIASSPEALDLWFGDEFAPGDVHIFIGAGSAQTLFDPLDVTGMSAAEILQAGIETEGDDSSASYAEPESFVIEDRQAAGVFVSQPKSEGYAVVIRYTDNFFVVAQVQTAVGELERSQKTLLEMLHRL